MLKSQFVSTSLGDPLPAQEAVLEAWQAGGPEFAGGRRHLLVSTHVPAAFTPCAQAGPCCTVTFCHPLSQHQYRAHLPRCMDGGMLRPVGGRLLNKRRIT